MNPGKLNKRIKILEFAEGEDGAGGYLDNWITGEGWNEIITVWANINPLSGRDLIMAQQTMSEITHKITIRYNSNIKSSHIIAYNSRRFDIQYIRNTQEKNTYLEILCVEKV